MARSGKADMSNGKDKASHAKTRTAPKVCRALRQFMFTVNTLILVEEPYFTMEKRSRCRRSGLARDCSIPGKHGSLRNGAVRPIAEISFLHL